MKDFIIREAKPGEPSLVVSFYFKLFEQQFAFLPVVEQYFLHAMAELYDQPAQNRLWIAEEDGQIKGSICVVKREDHEAQLRIFGIDPSMQGKGVGKALLQKAMDYCAEQGFTHIVLWTIDICETALHLYEKAGFQMTDTKRNTTWANYEMTEEKWEFFGA